VSSSSYFLYLMAHAAADVNQQNKIKRLLFSFIEDPEVTFREARQNTAIFRQHLRIDMDQRNARLKCGIILSRDRNAK